MYRRSLDEQEVGTVDCEIAELGFSDPDAMVVAEREEAKRLTDGSRHCKPSTRASSSSR